MSDPQYRDPRADPPPLREEDIRSQRLSELNSSNAMWGWVAGAVVLALVLVFIFARSPSDEPSTASLPQQPPATTGSAPPANPAPPPAARAPQSNPSTTGQGGAQQ